MRVHGEDNNILKAQVGYIRVRSITRPVLTPIAQSTYGIVSRTLTKLTVRTTKSLNIELKTRSV